MRSLPLCESGPPLSCLHPFDAISQRLPHRIAEHRPLIALRLDRNRQDDPSLLPRTRPRHVLQTL